MTDKMSSMIKTSAARSKALRPSPANISSEIPQFIITDPCYIMTDAEYDALGMATNWHMDFSDARQFTYRKDPSQKILIFKNKGTKFGDGSTKYHGRDVDVDSGQLCIAYNVNGWALEKWAGARFFSLEEARKAWPGIYRRF